MALTLFGRFVLTCLRSNGTGVAGVRIRLLNTAGTDVTANFFGTVVPETDANGVLTKSVSPLRLLLPGIYTIQLLANGFEPFSILSPSDFNGRGSFTVTLTPETTVGDYLVTEPGNYCSSMLPIVLSVDSPARHDYELITAQVSHLNGATSILESPVDKRTGSARLDLRSRVHLGTDPLLVPSGQIARPDDEFSTVITVDPGTITPETTVSLGQAFSRAVAHTLPPVNEADLSAYVAAQERDWIVPAQPVIAFRGHYRDVMVWLPQPGDYVLTVTDYDGENNSVGLTELTPLTDNPLVQRIRLNTNPDPSVVRTVLTILSSGFALTKPLTVLYRD